MRRHLAILASASLLALLGAAALPGVAIAAPPPNDDFADAVVLVGLTAEVAGTNVEATAETGEPAHADSGGPIESVWYSWTAPVSSRFRIDTCVIDYNSTLAVYTGSSVDALTLIGGNDDSGVAGCGFSGNTFGSIVEFDAVAGTTYRIAVDGQGSNEGTFTLSLEPTAGVGTLTVRKSTCTDITASTLLEMAFVARAACSSADAVFAVEPAGQDVVVARIQTLGGTGTVQLVAGDYDVTETSPAVVGPEPITLARDASVTVVAENPAAAAGGGASPTPTPTPAPTPRATMLSDTSTTAVTVAAGGGGSTLAVVATLALVLASASVWAAVIARRTPR